MVTILDQDSMVFPRLSMAILLYKILDLSYKMSRKLMGREAVSLGLTIKSDFHDQSWFSNFSVLK